MALKFGLNIQKKGPALPNKSAPARKPTAFNQDASDDEEDTTPTTNNDNDTNSITTFDTSTTTTTTSKPQSTSSITAKPKSKPTLPSTNRTDLSTLRSISTLQSTATTLDPSIYDYDSAYDTIHSATTAKTLAAQEDAATRTPKYMTSLLAAAEVRKRDQLRAKDRLLQRQREEEGDEFADKDAFVTEAYKMQQAEGRKLEAEEAAREEKEAVARRGKGMSGFYRGFMEREERVHREVVDAAEKARVEGAGDGERVKVEEIQEEEKSALEQAKELNEKGANVMINEDGQVVDKRQLLTAGLNVAPKRKLDGTTAQASTTARPAQSQAYRGKTEGQKAMRERQSRMMEEQLEAATRKAAEEEEEERAKLERAAKSRKTEGEVVGARERYLARKREAEAATARREE